MTTFTTTSKRLSRKLFYSVQMSAKGLVIVVLVISAMMSSHQLMAMDYPLGQKDRQVLFDLTLGNQLLLLSSFESLSKNSHDSQLLFQVINELTIKYGVDLSVIVLKNWLKISGKSLHSIIDKEGSTILHLACEIPTYIERRQHVNCLETILKVADSTLMLAKTYDGWTALMCAAYSGEPNAIRMLLVAMDAFGCKEDLLFMSDDSGLTALHLAAWSGEQSNVYNLLVAADQFGRAKAFAYAHSSNTDMFPVTPFAPSRDILNITALDYANKELVKCKDDASTTRTYSYGAQQRRKCERVVCRKKYEYILKILAKFCDNIDQGRLSDSPENDDDLYE